ncbi:sigma-70 family RNA polymerase sigma factor [Tunturibacter psychrotolerans]|uniref:Sigma-70 family RNA polymerase sigma factor n=1 Tax=Tunturiibacter psychrotolerans TaxID=3069686 RepID=A0AAU7ZL88_9BACT
MEIFMQSCGARANIDLNCFGTTTSEAILVEAAKSGDHSAFEELWARHSDTAFRSAYRILRNRDDAEDTLQDAWMKAFVHLKTFDGRSQFSTWLTRIAINSALMVLRRKRSHPETSMDGSGDGETWDQWEVPDNRSNIEDLYLKKEAELKLKEAIESLRPPLRIVMEIQRFHDGTNKEIADAAGISVAALKSRLVRARALLRSSLQSSMSPRKHGDTPSFGLRC